MQLATSMEEQPEPFTLEGDPSVISNEQTTVFVNQASVLPVQKNKAAEVIGWLVIIYYGLGVAMGLLSILGFSALSSEFAEEPGFETIPVTLLAVTWLLGLIPAVIGIIGGWKMTKYEKNGIWFVFGALALAWVMSLVNGALTSDYAGTGNAGFDAAFNGMCGIFCVAICGVIVAIPLMLSDGGME